MLKSLKKLSKQFFLYFLHKMLTDEQKQKITQRLNDKQALRACPRCGQLNFTLVDGIFNQIVQDDIKNIKLGGGTALPTIIVSCDNCGFLSQHSIGVLGLFDEFK